MSVYSGFASRAQEGSYNRALYNVLCLLQLKVARSLRGEQFDDSVLQKYFAKFYHKLCVLDDCKYLVPKFSCAMKDLALHFGISDRPLSQRPPSLSSTSSNLSFQQFQLSNSAVPAADVSELAKQSPYAMSHNFAVNSGLLAGRPPQSQDARTPEAGHATNTRSDSCPKSAHHWRLKPQLPQSSNRAPHPLLHTNPNPKPMSKPMSMSMSMSMSRPRQKSKSKPKPDHSKPTINNNNIVITINKSFNLRGEEDREGEFNTRANASPSPNSNRWTQPQQVSRRQATNMESIYSPSTQRVRNLRARRWARADPQTRFSQQNATTGHSRRERVPPREPEMPELMSKMQTQDYGSTGLNPIKSMYESEGENLDISGLPGSGPGPGPRHLPLQPGTLRHNMDAMTSKRRTRRLAARRSNKLPAGYAQFNRFMPIVRRANG